MGPDRQQAPQLDSLCDFCILEGQGGCWTLGLRQALLQNSPQACQGSKQVSYLLTICRSAIWGDVQLAFFCWPHLASDSAIDSFPLAIQWLRLHLAVQGCVGSHTWIRSPDQGTKAPHALGCGQNFL